MQGQGSQDPWESEKIVREYLPVSRRVKHGGEGGGGGRDRGK
jgi:hypothetical protein